MTPPLPFTGPWLLAPMEGVTEACFRDAVLSRHAPEGLGGAFTEFVRVRERAIPVESLAERLGPRRFPQPVGLQLMGSDPDPLAASVDAAIRAGAPLVDLNFGCPSPKHFGACAGSALLAWPERVEALVRACVTAADGRVPVTAKIRSGVEDDRRLEELARAAEAGGASMLTVHCRTRDEGYRDCADWGRIARAVAAVRIPVCGNGSIRRHGDLARMRSETGCAWAMVGRAALSNPWIFSDVAAGPADGARFLLDYAALMQERSGFGAVRTLFRLRQLLGCMASGGVLARAGEPPAEADRRRKLQAEDLAPVLAWLEERACAPVAAAQPV